MALKRMIELSSPFGKKLLFERVTGSETLGRAFEYEIHAISKDANLDFEELLGHHVTLKIELPDDGVRHLDARVAQFGLVGMCGQNYWRYRIVARSWTWILTRTADCKIFQEKTVPEIIEEVFGDHGDVDYDLRLTVTYPKREYCVQYRESDFDFVSRLMEEEGIYTYFEHEEGKHLLVICDAVTAHSSVGTVPFYPQTKATREGDEYVREWRVHAEIQPGTTCLRDYDFKRPSTDLTVQRTLERPHADSLHEVFDYPGEYVEVADGEHLVRMRLEEWQAAHEQIEGVGNARALACGGLFTLSEFARKDQNREYLIVSNRTQAVDNSYESGKQEGIDYSCTFTLIPSKEPYRTPRTTPRPIVRGPQTALVVGPAGEEIFCDEYGRVKVQFYWDRLGKKDDKSSCFIRVSQMWAGKTYGWMTVPRIGQEVVVSFLEGNPDNPLITGRVYNAEQMPPWALPSNKTQSGILTRSSAGGSPDNANQLRFEDKKGSEQVYLHAEKDMDRHVENNDSTFVGNDKFLTVTRDQKNTIKRDRWETVERDQHLTVTRDRVTAINNNETRTVAVDQVMTIGANQSAQIAANQALEVGGNQSTQVGGNVDVTIGGNRAESIGGNESRSVGGMQSINAGGVLSIKAPTISFEAGHFDWKVSGGSSTIVESPSGPYQMMVNKLEVMSSSEINLFAATAINSVSTDNNTTIMGQNNSAYIGMSSDVNIALARDTFMGAKMEAAIAVAISSFVGINIEQMAAIKLTQTSGFNIEMDSMKALNPGGGGGGGGGGPIAKLANVMAANAARIAQGAQWGGLLAILRGEYELYNQYTDAKNQVRAAAAAAKAAGHHSLADRLNAMQRGDGPDGDTPAPDTRGPTGGSGGSGGSDSGSSEGSGGTGPAPSSASQAPDDGGTSDPGEGGTSDPQDAGVPDPAGVGPTNDESGTSDPGGETPDGGTSQDGPLPPDWDWNEPPPGGGG